MKFNLLLILLLKTKIDFFPDESFNFFEKEIIQRNINLEKNLFQDYFF